MLNLGFIFQDAINSLEKFGGTLSIAPLPATVFLLQQDVINHYEYAISHYFPLSLDKPFLQNSSLGTPYQKWAKFTNDDFELLHFCILNLLRYSSRLLHESEIRAKTEAREFEGLKNRSNRYTEIICDLKHSHRFVGVRVAENQSLTICRVESRDEHTADWSNPSIVCEHHDISDRTIIQSLGADASREIAELRALHDRFDHACQAYYTNNKPIEQFSSLNAPYWV